MAACPILAIIHRMRHHAVTCAAALSLLLPVPLAVTMLGRGERKGRLGLGLILKVVGGQHGVPKHALIKLCDPQEIGPMARQLVPACKHRVQHISSGSVRWRCLQGGEVLGERMLRASP